MRGSIVLILLLVILGFFAVISEAQTVDGASVVPQILQATSGEEEAAVTKIVPQVDRSDDPAEDLPCTDQPNDCSLRSAIMKANNADQALNITFADHYIIVLTRPLPPLTASGTNIVAQMGQEVRVNGNYQPAPVFHLAAADIRLEGLRIFGAGAGYPNVLVNGPAQNVVIARNVIGDDDAPDGNCGQNQQASSGIYVQAGENVVDGPRVWIFGNIIECHVGANADGLIIKADGVMVGVDAKGQAGEAQQNVFRWNQGVAVRLDNYGGNTVQNNLIHDNAGGDIAMTNYTNNIIQNDIR